MKRLDKRLVHFGASLGCLLAGLVLAGFVQIRFTPTSSGFKWPTTTIRYVIQEKGSDDVPDKSDETALRLAFRAWEQVPDSFIRFSEDTFADASRTDYTATDIHLVMWDEDGTSGLFPEGSNVIALTPVLASTSDGTVLDADIVFNGKLSFTTDPTQQSSRFDVQAVATHEIGHFIGLDHSNGTFSTMFASIPSGTTYCRSLEEDDAAGAAVLYGTAATTRATIQGTITRVGGGSVAYVQVVAVNQTSGAIGGQALSDSSGAYRLEGLLPGSYDLYVEPVNGPFGLADTIGFKNVSSSNVVTTFNPANPVAVTAGQSVGASWTVPTGAPTINVSAVAGGQMTIGNNGALAIVGSGLDKVTSASVTGAGVVVTGISSQSAGGMIVSLSVNAGATTGVRNLVLTAPGEQVVATAAVDVIQALPIVSSATPVELKAQGGETITVSGVNLVDGSQVVIGGQLASGVNVAADGLSLTAITPPSPGTTAAQDLVVIRPDGREARLRDFLFYEDAPAPASIDPAVGPAAGGTIHTITGGGFTAPLAVRFDGVAAEVLSVTASKIKVRLPPHAAGQVDLTVTAEGKTGLLQDALTYVAASAPLVDSFSPSTGTTAGGTEVTIRGSGFEASTEVRFGGSLANVTEASTTELRVQTPAHATGQVEVRVTNPSTGLSSGAVSPFTYDDSPPPPGGGGGGSDCRIGVGPAGPGGLALLFALGLLLALRRVPTSVAGARRAT